MSKPMPVGLPYPRNLNLEDFKRENFYGFVQATVKAPAPDTPGGYIGLLPIKYEGRLICPGGVFSGLFFSEELRFALVHGYTLLEIKGGIQFTPGRSCFLELITQLNSMKIEAQMNKQPTIRNLAKLLMNSMYGRFGMHPSLIKNSFRTEEQLENLSSLWIIQNKIDFNHLSLVSLLLNQEWILQNKGKQELIRVLMDSGNNTNVAIAAAVTAHSRMLINSYKIYALKNNYELYYSDTDSLVLNKELPPHMIDSATLGKLKLGKVLFLFLGRKIRVFPSPFLNCRFTKLWNF
jgi:hypothetical protein